MQFNPTEIEELHSRATAKVLAGEMRSAEARKLILDAIVTMVIREAVKRAIEEMEKEGEL